MDERKNMGVRVYKSRLGGLVKPASIRQFYWSLVLTVFSGFSSGSLDYQFL
jgi:hypothetical protein